MRLLVVHTHTCVLAIIVGRVGWNFASLDHFKTAQKKNFACKLLVEKPVTSSTDQEHSGHTRVMYPSWRLLCQPEAAKMSNHDSDRQVQVTMIVRRAELRLALIRSSLRSLKRCSLSCEAIEIGGYC